MLPKGLDWFTPGLNLSNLVGGLKTSHETSKDIFPALLFVRNGEHVVNHPIWVSHLNHCPRATGERQQRRSQQNIVVQLLKPPSTGSSTYAKLEANAIQYSCTKVFYDNVSSISISTSYLWKFQDDGQWWLVVFLLFGELFPFFSLSKDDLYGSNKRGVGDSWCHWICSSYACWSYRHNWTQMKFSACALVPNMAKEQIEVGIFWHSWSARCPFVWSWRMSSGADQNCSRFFKWMWTVQEHPVACWMHETGIPRHSWTHHQIRRCAKFWEWGWVMLSFLLSKISKHYWIVFLFKLFTSSFFPKFGHQVKDSKPWSCSCFRFGDMFFKVQWKPKIQTQKCWNLYIAWVWVVGIVGIGK